MRHPGTCSHPFHDEPFRKVKEVSPAPALRGGICLCEVSGTSWSNSRCPLHQGTSSFGMPFRGIGREDAGSPAERQQPSKLHNEGSSPSSPSKAESDTREFKAAIEFALEFIQEPEWFPNEGDRQFWRERKQGAARELKAVLDLARRALRDPDYVNAAIDEIERLARGERHPDGQRS